ncbi:anti-sigma factor [Leptolyngbya sp. 'hensonii']|uniref:anti-sigma factor n=1 Tax=Leptolyngbya sp. 'hensonii' TaxID=1922337 RepID=UPI0009503223|nr:anti-sigma factor [Leptolyngbya sp. 'hensonii']OLP16949.1 anti-sigma factor [Leptolyngbya sp. 'hensonii']
MTERFPPERLDELMAGYVLGNLSPEEAEVLRRHLADHPELATELQRLQQVLETMPYALPEVCPSEALRSTILGAAAMPSNWVPIQRPKLGTSVRRWGILAGVAALAVAIGLDSYRLRQQIVVLRTQVAKQHDVITMLQQPKTHLVSLKGMDQAAEASGSIVVTPGEPKAVLLLRNLPALPKGQHYQLWLVIDGEKVAWEHFNANENGFVFTKLSLLDDSQITTLVVTVEGSPDPKIPTGPMVMTSSL